MVFCLVLFVSSLVCFFFFFFFSSRRRHTRCLSDWSSDVCSSDLRRFRCARYRSRLAHAEPCAPGDGASAFCPNDRSIQARPQASSQTPPPPPARARAACVLRRWMHGSDLDRAWLYGRADG